MDNGSTKVLFIDDDELSFHFQKCMADIIEGLPHLELFYASDATEGLAMLESLEPHVVILDHENDEEQELFLDSLSPTHPPVLVQTEEEDPKQNRDLSNIDLASHINKIPKSDSLESIHQKLLLAARLANKDSQLPKSDEVH